MFLADGKASLDPLRSVQFSSVQFSGSCRQDSSVRVQSRRSLPGSVLAQRQPSLAPWYGVVWCGVVWYGMVWYGMVWYAHYVEFSLGYGMAWFGMEWYGGYVDGSTPMVWYAHDVGFSSLQPLATISSPTMLGSVQFSPKASISSPTMLSSVQFSSGYSLIAELN